MHPADKFVDTIKLAIAKAVAKRRRAYYYVDKLPTEAELLGEMYLYIREQWPVLMAKALRIGLPDAVFAKAYRHCYDTMIPEACGLRRTSEYIGPGKRRNVWVPDNATLVPQSWEEEENREDDNEEAA